MRFLALRPRRGHAVSWEPVATILRSQCHALTWIGHVPGAGHVDTPAGPLRVVKAAVIEMVAEPGDRFRWQRHGSGDGYELQVNSDSPPAPRQHTSPRIVKWA